MDPIAFEKVKEQVRLCGDMARHIRFAGARYVYTGSNLESNARMLVQRTITALDIERVMDIDDLSTEQYAEVIRVAKQSLFEFVQLPAERAAGMSGSEIHDTLVSGC